MLVEHVNIESGFPSQRISWRKKTKKWGIQCVEYGASKNAFTYSPVRNSMIHKKINYDLVNGKIHMADLALVLDSSALGEDITPDLIQHYPTINGKLNVLRGEEFGRAFDYKVIVTNPNAISEIEKAKTAEMVKRIQEQIANTAQSEEEYMEAMQQEMKDMLNWQDANERVTNELMSDYHRKLEFKEMYNSGFFDGLTCGEELYQCFINRGEPGIRRLDPKIVDWYRSGVSSRPEDADMMVITDYLSRGQIIDAWGDLMTDKEVEYVENYKDHNDNYDDFWRTDGLGKSNPITDFGGKENPDGTYDVDWENQKQLTPADLMIPDNSIEEYMPYDIYGNIRVCQVYWKSLRKIKKIKSYNPITGEVEYSLHTEDYIPNKEMGEEEQAMWINEAWQGVKIGEKLYVDIRPCPVQRNDIDNPSKCDFGIVGGVYNIGGDEPFSMVDMMKPYAYLYDATMDKLKKLLARNHGKVIDLDLALVPEKWDITDYMKIITEAGVSVRDSFREGQQGAARGKLAGMMNNASRGTIDLDLSGSISNLINILTFIDQILGKSVGITDQREGQIQNRETVGGVERSVLQSSHITEWLFMVHDSIKRRSIECFLDYARAALRGRNKKFQYTISSDLAQKIVDVDGDAFAMNSYGLVVDNSYDTQEFTRNLPQIIQAALQNDKLSLGGLMKLYNSSSRAEKQKAIEDDEQAKYQRDREAVESQNAAQQQVAQMEQQTKIAQMEHEAAMNTENNETKILVAEIQARNSGVQQQTDTGMTESERANLDEKKREFDEKYKLDKQRLDFDKDRAKTDAELKKRQINKTSTSSK